MSGMGNILPLFLDDESFLDLLKQLVDEVFSLDLGQYDNLKLSSVGLGNLRSVVVAIFVGIIIATYCIIFNRGVYGNFVRALVDRNCGGTSSALTLDQLGFKKNAAVRSALKRGNVYRGIVRCVGEDEYNENLERKRAHYTASLEDGGVKAAQFRSVAYKIDFEKDRFYIPEDKHFSAGERFNKKGTGVLPAILITVLAIVFLWLTLKLLPEMLQLADNFVGMVGGGTNIN